jgi:type VI secretion system protein ImpK
MTPPDVQERTPKQTIEPAIGSENLALFYQGLLTGIVRVQARRQHIPEGEIFRRRTKAALQEVERDAVAAGYDGGDVRETHFAVVAFLDSVVLNSNDPVRAEWERQTPQEELFGQTDAGGVFLEKLERFRARRDSDQLADILEFTYSAYLGVWGGIPADCGRVDSIVERLRMRIEDIRGRNGRISPNGALPVEAVSPAPGPVRPANRWLLMTLGAVVVALLCFLVLFIQLSWTSGQVRGVLF